MQELNRWDIAFEHHKYPCFITDKETGILLFYNKSFGVLFDIHDNMVGKSMTEVISPEDHQIEETLPDWTVGTTFVSESYNQKLNKRFVLRGTYFEEERAVFCELIPSEADLEANLDFENAMTKCMEIFSQPEETVLTSFMELLSQFYGSDRAYVYRFHFETNTINCVAQWNQHSEMKVTQEIGQKMDAAFLINWIQRENKSGIIMARQGDSDVDPTLAKIMDLFQMKNLILCTVEDASHKVVGIVGLSNRKEWDQYFDRRLINTISRFVAQDVNQQAIDATLFHVYNRDTLTGLYNRSAYGKRIDAILNEKPNSMGVISANINGLRYINENSGIAGGDAHIKKSAHRMKKHFGFEMFRISGDEFIGLAPNIAEDTFENLVNDLHEEKRKEGNYDFSMGHSWGKGRIDMFKLIQEADALMYINKQEYYSSSDRKFDIVNDTTLSDLLSFLEEDEFMIYLQPQVRLQDGSLHGAEALIRRFDKKNQKMVFPDQFISLYEQKSVIRHVDLFVVETVCKLLQQWEEYGKSIPISVNLSRVTLQEYGIVETIVEICSRYHIPHHLLVIEVTERVGLIENNVASALITAFKEYGFNISLDDFGCAYSNIVTLAQIEVDEVKIDKSLVDDLTNSKKNHILVKNVLSMCNELDGASTLAEGIEDESQAALLRDLGCSLGQGYFYSRPIPHEEFFQKYIKG